MVVVDCKSGLILRSRDRQAREYIYSGKVLLFQTKFNWTATRS
jgi:hypothetical protein